MMRVESHHQKLKPVAPSSDSASVNARMPPLRFPAISNATTAATPPTIAATSSLGTCTRVMPARRTAFIVRENADTAVSENSVMNARLYPSAAVAPVSRAGTLRIRYPK